VLSVAKILRMPNTETLPKGARRKCVEELFLHYREAGRPTVRTVADWIRDNDSLSGTASAETVRRVLVGLTVPRNWATVEAILYLLCTRARTDPAAGLRWSLWRHRHQATTRRSHYKRRDATTSP
jgi:hypothetical protein